jgi:hypothetical protein
VNMTLINHGNTLITNAIKAEKEARGNTERLRIAGSLYINGSRCLVACGDSDLRRIKAAGRAALCYQRAGDMAKAWSIMEAVYLSAMRSGREEMAEAVGAWLNNVAEIK